MYNTMGIWMCRWGSIGRFATCTFKHEYTTTVRRLWMVTLFEVELITQSRRHRIGVLVTTDSMLKSNILQ